MSQSFAIVLGEDGGDGDDGSGEINNEVNYDYTIDNDTDTVTLDRYTGPVDINLTIPSEIDGKSVTVIGDGAFSLGNGTKFKSIYIPDTIKEVGSSAFHGIIVPSISIPNSVTKIGENAFQKVETEEIKLSEKVESIETYAFLQTKVTNLVIPDGVTNIKQYAFNGSKIKKMHLGNGLVNIEENAFLSSEIGKVTSDGGPRIIDRYAFQYAKIDEIELGENLTELGEYSFLNSEINKFKLVSGPDIIKDYAFQNAKVNEISLGNKLTTIGNNSFMHFESNELTMPDTVVEIGEYAFQFSTIENIHLNEGLKKIRKGAFLSSGIKNLKIPKTVESIEEEAFLGTDLNKLEINGDNLIISSNAFLNSISDKKDAELIINEGVKELQGTVFVDLAIPRLELPKSLELMKDQSIIFSDQSEIIVKNKDITLEDEALFGNGNSLILVGHKNSSAREFAKEYGHEFKIGTGEFSFKAIGGLDELNKIASIEVNLKNHDEDHPIEYVWSKNESPPTDGWKGIENGEIVESPLHITGDYTLFVRGYDILGDLIENSYGKISVHSIAPDKPNINVPENWVNEDVTIKLTSDTESIEYRINDGEWVLYEGEFVFKKEGQSTIEARSIDSVGNISEINKSVIKIDKGNPILNIEVDESKGSLIIKGTDGLSGVKEIFLPNGEVIKANIAEFIVEKSGTYKFSVVDNAGNVTEETFDIIVHEEGGISTTPSPGNGANNGENENQGKDTKDSEGLVVPDTATNNYNFILLGLTLILLGAAYYFFYIRKRDLDKETNKI